MNTRFVTPLLVCHRTTNTPYVLHRYDFDTGKCLWRTTLTDTFIDHAIANSDQSKSYGDWCQMLEQIRDRLLDQNRFTRDELMIVY